MSDIDALAEIGSSAIFWRQQAENMERQRDAAFREVDAVQARADGYALLVKELQAHLTPVIDLGGSGGGWQEVECCVCRARWYGGAADTPQIVHEHDCILAEDPEARAAELLAGQEDKR